MSQIADVNCRTLDEPLNHCQACQLNLSKQKRNKHNKHTNLPVAGPDEWSTSSRLTAVVTLTIFLPVPIQH